MHVHVVEAKDHWKQSVLLCVCVRICVFVTTVEDDEVTRFLLSCIAYSDVCALIKPVSFAVCARDVAHLSVVFFVEREDKKNELIVYNI